MGSMIREDRLLRGPRVASSSPGARPGKVVLLAESDARRRHSVSRELRRVGYSVLEAADGHELADALASWILRRPGAPNVDVLITDAELNGWDGLSIVRDLASSGWPLPTLVLSSAKPKKHVLLAGLPNVLVVDPAYAATGIERYVKSLMSCSLTAGVRSFLLRPPSLVAEHVRRRTKRKAARADRARGK